MFGDVGGLYDFLVILFALIFKFFANKLMIRELASKLFHFSSLSAEGLVTPMAALSKIKRLKVNKLLLDRKR